ncbi:hypothetical protein ACFL27_16355 [candidate division CSSED10-310 bacterium]|uniref:RNA polymerase alpha subunit C-terminal domain-containing protein n=1 Tax=candidate division CSSED10-310 bacterium TaxID=2855610 RepID=A0ABV6YZZ7_UNCC1
MDDELDAITEPEVTAAEDSENIDLDNDLFADEEPEPDLDQEDEEITIDDDSETIDMMVENESDGESERASELDVEFVSDEAAFDPDQQFIEEDQNLQSEEEIIFDQDEQIDLIEPESQVEQITPSTKPAAVSEGAHPIPAPPAEDIIITDFSKAPRLMVSTTELTTLNVEMDEGYLLSLIDGSTSLQDIIHISGMGRDKALQHVKKLISNGLVKLS